MAGIAHAAKVDRIEPTDWYVGMKIMNLTHTPMALWNLSLIDFHPDWTVLDVGCGGGKNIAVC
ncbi:MAG: hypothetical protein II822_08480 [Prevotella sp.]|nr:hypothetical protein [Prevotella sp.]